MSQQVRCFYSLHPTIDRKRKREKKQIQFSIMFVDRYLSLLFILDKNSHSVNNNRFGIVETVDWRKIFILASVSYAADMRD